MSTNYSASVIFGYRLPSSELERHTPNPLWGKHKFDPETGDKVTKFIEKEIELALEDGDILKHMTRFVRTDTRGFILLGIELADTGDLDYGDTAPQAFTFPSLADRDAVAREVMKLLSKATIAFDPNRMGYWLAGRVC